jgi:hypothetical protein
MGRQSMIKERLEERDLVVSYAQRVGYDDLECVLEVSQPILSGSHMQATLRRDPSFATHSCKDDYFRIRHKFLVFSCLASGVSNWLA